jgi:hypothetical protein
VIRELFRWPAIFFIIRRLQEVVFLKFGAFYRIEGGTLTLAIYSCHALYMPTTGTISHRMVASIQCFIGRNS